MAFVEEGFQKANLFAVLFENTWFACRGVLKQLIYLPFCAAGPRRAAPARASLGLGPGFAFPGWYHRCIIWARFEHQLVIIAGRLSYRGSI